MRSDSIDFDLFNVSYLAVIRHDHNGLKTGRTIKSIYLDLNQCIQSSVSDD